MLLNKMQSAQISIASTLFFLLLTTDLVFFGVHFASAILTGERHPLFSIDFERSYGEIFQYIKEFWLTLLMINAIRVTGQRGYYAWVMIFLFTLCDDMFQIHEYGGDWLAMQLYAASAWGIKAQDVGELKVFAIAGVVLMAFMLAALWRGSTTFRRVTLDLLMLFSVLVFFAVFVDLMHAVWGIGKLKSFVLATIEDGGEMIAMSLLLWYVFRATEVRWQAPGNLYQMVLPTGLAARVDALIAWRPGRVG